MIIDLALGEAHWQAPTNCTTWYQCGMPYSDKLNDLTFKIGLKQDRWSFGFVNLGKTSVNAQALVDEKQYLAGKRSCGRNALCADFKGSGSAYGAYLTYDFIQYKGLNLELGAALLKPSWKEDVSGTYPCKTPGYGGQFSASRVTLSPMIGVRYDINKTFAVSSETYFKVDTGNKLPQYPGGMVTTVNLHARF